MTHENTHIQMEHMQNMGANFKINSIENILNKAMNKLEYLTLIPLNLLNHVLIV